MRTACSRSSRIRRVRAQDTTRSCSSPAGTVNDLIAFRGALVAAGSMSHGERTDGGRVALDQRRDHVADGIERVAPARHRTIGGHQARPRGRRHDLTARRTGIPRHRKHPPGCRPVPRLRLDVERRSRTSGSAPTFENCGRTGQPRGHGPRRDPFVNGDNATRWRRSGNEWLPHRIPAEVAGFRPVDRGHRGQRARLRRGRLLRAADKNVNEPSERSGGAPTAALEARRDRRARPTKGSATAAFTGVAYSSAGWIAVGRRSHRRSRSRLGRRDAFGPRATAGTGLRAQRDGVRVRAVRGSHRRRRDCGFGFASTTARGRQRSLRRPSPTTTCSGSDRMPATDRHDRRLDARGRRARRPVAPSRSRARSPRRAPRARRTPRPSPPTATSRSNLPPGRLHVRRP